MRSNELASRRQFSDEVTFLNIKTDAMMHSTKTESWSVSLRVMDGTYNCRPLQSIKGGG